MGDAPALPFVSVIVPVYNDPARLARCLAALEAQTYPADGYEVIVVDNGSEPPVAVAPVAFPHAQFAREPQPGCNRARAVGLARARGELIAFTDADCLPEPEWIAAGVACFHQTPNCGLVGGRIEVVAEQSNAAAILSCATHLRQERFVREGRWAVLANAFTSREVVATVGAPDPELLSSAEVEWGRRIHAAGHALTYAAAAVVRHPARTTIRQHCRRARRFESAWKQLRDRAGVGTGWRFWVGQHLVWPVRDLWQELIRSPKFTLDQKVRASALACFLIGLRLVVWALLRLGLRVDVRKNWG